MKNGSITTTKTTLLRAHNPSRIPHHASRITYHASRIPDPPSPTPVIVLPVIYRELRASARQAFTYHLRSLGVAVLLLASVLFGLEHGFGPVLGGKLFGSLHFTLFCAIWVLVPLLTADCISRERREGTLGLLFLTRLAATDIVVAKGLAQGLRALTLWLAVVPVLTVPFLLGGVSRSEVALSVLINFSSICWALAAGLLASAWGKAWLRALLRAAILATVFLLTLGMAVGEILLSSVSSWWWLHSDFAFIVGLGFLTNAMGNWPMYLRLASTSQFVSAMAQVTVISVVLLVVVILLAGAKTRRVWQEEPPSQRQLWWRAAFCTPILWRSFFRRWMRWKLERNPVGWLEQRTWSGRLVTWGWLAVIISLYSAVLTDRNFLRNDLPLQVFIAWLLTGSMALSAAASFRRERETGVLELLLVSPLGFAEILSGRLRGLWGQFLPAFAMLLGLWYYFSRIFGRSETESISFFAITFLTLPVIGLYYSLRCRNFVSAFLATLALGLLAPMVLSAPLQWILLLYYPAFTGLFFRFHIGPSIQAGFFQIVIAAICLRRLHTRLRQRTFPLESTEK